MRDTSRATPWSGPSRLTPRASSLSPHHKREINLALRHCRDPHPSRLATNARYISRDATVGPLAPRPSRLTTNARYISRYAIAGTLSPLAPLASRLAPRASPPMRDTSRATPWFGPLAPRPSRLTTNARYISRYAIAGTLSPLAPLASRLAPRHQCEIHLARRHGSGPSRLVPLASPQTRDTSRATPLPGPSRLSRLSPHASRLATNARYISRDAMVRAPRASSLSPHHKREINLALRHCRDPHLSRLAPHP
ncbi:MAG: hypothetical protein KatS3mg058_4643 [Roseiflexus sp.]|nr:MAG: hypothetical protein KatS3mg058_4643 [Roseiflexus sp.]